MDLNKQKKIKMFKSMFKIREFEDVVKQIYRDGKLKGHLQTCQGQEAMEVGAIEALFKEDIYSYYFPPKLNLTLSTQPQHFYVVVAISPTSLS